MVSLYTDFIDLPSSVKDAKYGRVWSPTTVVVTTYSGSEIKLVPMVNNKKYRVRGINESSSSALGDEFVNSFNNTSTWNEIKDSIDDLHVDLIPNKRFKIQIKITKVNKSTPKFFLD